MAQPAAVEGPPLQVIATAGHVDHGKSSLIVRLTGIDPDRWDEEKRRGLTIDLGFAWCTLSSGREVGFVDVPGHERFVRNMLAGVGPVHLVLFVVAADEGWKPQSEEHLAIVDVLGAVGGVVALTKSDLVDQEKLALRRAEVEERLAGTSLESAPVVACSAVTGEGVEDLLATIERIVGAAPAPDDRGRPRISIDRSFTIKGAGTVVTGTLTGGTLAVGDEVELHPSGSLARIRSLQTHQRSVDVARPVSRVAANLAGTAKEEVERGDVLTRPGQWRPTDVLEARVRPVRSVEHPLSARGAYKLYLGSAERDVRVRFYGAPDLRRGGEAWARIRLARPVVAEVRDRFVLREAGRRETVAGGVVLDPDPPRRPGPDAAERLARRATAAREELAAILVAERRAVRITDVAPITGATPSEIPGAQRLGAWWVLGEAVDRLKSRVGDTLGAYHEEHPLRPGADWADVRRDLPGAEPALRPALEQNLAAALLAHLETTGVLVRRGNLVRLAAHQVTLGVREDEARRLTAVVAEGEPTPPDVRDLEAGGFSRELIEAVCSTGRLVAVSPDVVFTPEFVQRAEEVARGEASRPEGLTVSRFRQSLGTTRKYAMPLLARLDALGITRRDGDVRRLGGGPPGAD